MNPAKPVNLVKAAMVVSFWRDDETFLDRETSIARIVFTDTNVFEGTAVIEGNNKEYSIEKGAIDEDVGIVFYLINKGEKKKTFVFKPETIGLNCVFSSQGAWFEEGKSEINKALVNFVSEKFEF